METAYAGSSKNSELKGSESKSSEPRNSEQKSSEQKKMDHKEGPVARAIENQTAKVPSDVFLWLAGASIVGSATLKVLEMVRPSRKEPKGLLSLFVGMWAPTFLLLGLYNKVVKVAGSDQVS